jgi:alanyl aminopeptidase
MAVGMQVFGAPFLDQLLIARTQIDDPVFEQAVAFALGQNIDPDLSPRVLDLALSGELGSREAFTIVSGQMAQPTTSAETWVWLQANFVDYLDVIPRQRKRATPGLASSLCSEASIEELNALFEQHSSLVEGFERSLNQTSERIALCAALEAGKGDEVRTYFSGK